MRQNQVKETILWLCLVLASIGTSASSCTTTQAALELGNIEQLATSADSTAAVSAGVQPAPASMNNGQARKYYRAQLAAKKLDQARKVKNSHNTTIEQKNTNVSTAVLCIMATACVLCGCVVGFFIGRKL